MQAHKAAGRAMPGSEAMRVIDAVLQPLAALHRAGKTHGAVSPAAIARSASGWRLLPPESSRGVDLAGYQGPERARGGRPEMRDDVYAVGKLMLELLAGGRTEVLGTLPDELQEIVIRCTSPDPRWRYETAGTVLAALSAARGARFARAGRLILKIGVGTAMLGLIAAVSVMAISLARGQWPDAWYRGLEGLKPNAQQPDNRVAIATPVSIAVAARSGSLDPDASLEDVDPGEQAMSWPEQGETAHGVQGEWIDPATRDVGQVSNGDEGTAIAGIDDSPGVGADGGGLSAVDMAEGDLTQCKESEEIQLQLDGQGRHPNDEKRFSANLGESLLFGWDMPLSYTLSIRANGVFILKTDRLGGNLEIQPKQSTSYSMLATHPFCPPKEEKYYVALDERVLLVTGKVSVHEFDYVARSDEGTFPVTNMAISVNSAHPTDASEFASEQVGGEVRTTLKVNAELVDGAGTLKVTVYSYLYEYDGGVMGIGEGEDLVEKDEYVTILRPGKVLDLTLELEDSGDAAIYSLVIRNAPSFDRL